MLSNISPAASELGRAGLLKKGKQAVEIMRQMPQPFGDGSKPCFQEGIPSVQGSVYRCDSVL
jgi:hypothetical protein